MPFFYQHNDRLFRVEWTHLTYYSPGCTKWRFSLATAGAKVCFDFHSDNFLLSNKADAYFSVHRPVFPLVTKQSSMTQDVTVDFFCLIQKHLFITRMPHQQMSIIVSVFRHCPVIRTSHVSAVINGHCQYCTVWYDKTISLSFRLSLFVLQSKL